MTKEKLFKQTDASEGLLWHYTTLDTVSKILESKYFLATEVSFQNDIRETDTADSALLGALDKMEEDAKHSGFVKMIRDILPGLDSPISADADLLSNARFIFCASNDGDSLYAWRTYAQGGIGCAIGLDKTEHFGVVGPSSGTRKPEIHQWRQVKYGPDQIEAFALSKFRALADRYQNDFDHSTEMGHQDAWKEALLGLSAIRSDLRSCAKHGSFAAEQESRITVENVSIEAVVTTPSSMGPRPHIRLVSDKRSGSSVGYVDQQGAPQLPIRALRLGPDSPDSAFEATQWLLASNGYTLDSYPWIPGGETVAISKSKHPYRLV